MRANVLYESLNDLVAYLGDRGYALGTIQAYTQACEHFGQWLHLTVIALWLGHESPATTHMYMEADISMKRKALSRIQEPRDQPIRFRPTDKLLSFLESL